MQINWVKVVFVGSENVDNTAAKGKNDDEPFNAR